MRNISFSYSATVQLISFNSAFQRHEKCVYLLACVHQIKFGFVYAATREYDNPSKWIEIDKFVSDYWPQIGVRNWLNTSTRWAHSTVTKFTHKNQNRVFFSARALRNAFRLNIVYGFVFLRKLCETIIAIAVTQV